VHIYGSYRKIKTGVPFFWTTLYMLKSPRLAQTPWLPCNTHRSEILYKPLEMYPNFDPTRPNPMSNSLAQPDPRHEGISVAVHELFQNVDYSSVSMLRSTRIDPNPKRHKTDLAVFGHVLVFIPARIPCMTSWTASTLFDDSHDLMSVTVILWANTQILFENVTTGVRTQPNLTQLSVQIW